MASSGKRIKQPGFVKALMEMKRSEETEKFYVNVDDDSKAHIITVGMPGDTFLDDHLDLALDLYKWADMTGNRPTVTFEIIFSDNYNNPPFVRVKSPRFKFHTGHVTVGGSICTEMLTAEGWKPEMTGSALLLMLHATLIEGKGRIDMNGPRYCFTEALGAFDRVARDHGWSIPTNENVKR